MKLLPEKKLHRRLTLAAYIAVLLVGLYALLGFVIGPAVGKSKLPEVMAQTLHRNASVGDIRINPFTFDMEVSNFTVYRQAEDEDFISFSRLRINLDAWESLFSGAVTLNEFTLNDPMITVVRHMDGKFNFQDLLKGKNATAEPELIEENGEQGLGFTCTNINISGGHLIFDDRMEGVTLISSELNIAIPSISNVAAEETATGQDTADLSLSALIGNKTRLGVRGDLDLFQEAPHIDLRINLDKLPIKKFMAYAPKNLRISVSSGDLNLRTRFILSAPVNATTFSASGNASLTDFSVLGPDNREILKVPELQVNDLLYRFPSNRLDLAEIIIDRPVVVSSINAQGQINLTTLVAKDNSTTPAAGRANTTSPAPKKADAAEPGFNLNLAKAALQKGRVTFTDNSRAVPFNASVAPVDLSITGFSTNTSRPPASIRFKASSNMNATYEASAKVGLSPLKVTADIHAGGLVLPRYSAYFSHAILFDVPRGTAGFGAHLKLGETPEGFNAQVHNGTLEVKGLELTHRDDRGRYGTIESLEVGGATLDLLEQRVTVAGVALHGGDLDVVRAANGTLNLHELVAPTKKAEEAEEQAVQAVQNKTWAVLVEKVNVRDFDLSFEDQSPSKPFKLETTGITLNAGPFSQDLSTPIKAELSMEMSGGKLELKADAVPEPLSAKVDVAVSGLGLPAFTTFVSTDTHLALSKGTADVNGRVSLKQAGKDMRIKFTGNSRVRDFRAVDTRNKELALAWNAFDLEGISFVSSPMDISIKELALIKPYVDIIRDQNGTINLASMMKSKDGKHAAPAEKKPDSPKPDATKKHAEPALQFRVDHASIADGEIDFTDRSIQPAYEAELAEINATAAKLDLHSGKPADLALFAKLDDFGTVKVKGQGAMLTGAPSGDAEAAIKNISLVPFNPYSQKYLGYAIRGGKLSYTADASIKDRNIKATNIIRLDNIELGKKVNPNPVMDVPLALGVSLLKDSDGDIELDVPISGNLDDPKFDLSKEIFATTFRLFSQVVLAPFAFFQLDFGSAETGYVPFDAGSVELTADARANMDKLAKAVRSKPNMNLSITGYTDPTADLDGVKRYDMLHRAKLYKQKKLEEEGRRVRNPDSLKLDPQEYEDYLGDVYSEVIGGLTWGKDVKEMETEIMAALQVGNEELLRFGRRRAQAVRQYLSVSGRISPDRLFLLRPDTPEAPVEKDAPPIRADVTLNSE